MTLPAQDIVERREWLIRKDGYFYRPNCQGYTTRKIEAGRYTKVKAETEAAVEPWHMSAVHQDEVPDEPAVADLNATISRLTADNEALRKEVVEAAEARAAHHRTSHKAVKRLRALWREKQAAESRADALAQEVERLRADSHILARALFWFIQYPEYKPSPEFMEEVVSDLRDARPLVPSDRAALGDRP